VKKPLPKEIVFRLEETCALGRAAREKRALEEAEKLFTEAWELLPDPKAEWEYWPQSLSRGIVEHFLMVGQPEKAKPWLDVVREMYGKGAASDATIDFLAGRVHFEAGELDRARALFSALKKKYRKRPFQGYDRKYLRLVEP
jgi:hypothetical protein